MKKVAILILLIAACIAIIAPAHTYQWPLYGWTRLLTSAPIIYAGINFRRIGSITIALVMLLAQGPLVIQEMSSGAQWGIDYLVAATAIFTVSVIVGQAIRKEREISESINNAHVVMRKIQRAGDEAGLLDALEEQLRDRARAEAAGVWMLGEDGLLRDRKAPDGPPLPEGHVFYKVVETREFAAAMSPGDDERLEYFGGPEEKDNITRFAAFPIDYGGRARGVICIANMGVENFGAEAISYLAAIKQSVENTLELMERRRGKLRHEAEMRKARSAFTSYVSRTVAEEILKDPDNLELGGEARDVTVMFTEVVNFRKLMKELDPAELLSMLNEYFSIASDTIFEFDGTLDKFIGDNVMAFWGAPLQVVDGEARALGCAKKLQGRISGLNEGWAAKGRPQFNVCIGINSGQVVAGNIGSIRRMEYTIIGDTVNLAARIKSLSASENIPILVSEHTRGRVSDSFNFTGAFEAEVKGKSEKIKVYMLAQDGAGVA